MVPLIPYFITCEKELVRVVFMEPQTPFEALGCRWGLRLPGAMKMALQVQWGCRARQLPPLWDVCPDSCCLLQALKALSSNTVPRVFCICFLQWCFTMTSHLTSLDQCLHFSPLPLLYSWECMAYSCIQSLKEKWTPFWTWLSLALTCTAKTLLNFTDFVSLQSEWEQISLLSWASLGLLQTSLWVWLMQKIRRSFACFKGK